MGRGEGVRLEEVKRGVDHRARVKDCVVCNLLLGGLGLTHATLDDGVPDVEELGYFRLQDHSCFDV